MAKRLYSIVVSSGTSGDESPTASQNQTGIIPTRNYILYSDGNFDTLV